MKSDELFSVIRSRQQEFKGARAEERAVAAMGVEFGIPDDFLWFRIIREYALCGVSLSYEYDGSEFLMRIMTPQEIMEEMTELYPGIACRSVRLLAIAECLQGSGNPFFFPMDGDENSPVVQVDHDLLELDEESDEYRVVESGVFPVAPSLASLFKSCRFD